MWTHLDFARHRRFGYGLTGRVGVAACVIFMLTACQRITMQVTRPIENVPSPPIVMDGGFCNGNMESVRLFFRTGSVMPVDGWKERMRGFIENARCGPLRETDTILVGFDNQNGEIDSSVLMRNLNAGRGRLISEYLRSLGVDRFRVDLDARPGFYEIDRVGNGNSLTGAYVELLIYRCTSQGSGKRHFAPRANDGMTQEKAKTGRVDAADREIATC
ncbi:hypothetical protein LGN17_36325 [Burkholderia sp. AU30280]|uniref:hypothetical protein n=1 Tax=Burkholderia sp. AU30280 TaxID=2879628 RepID=UPI001CF5E19F|nr:hypothetical protein [Burkholderia sp. AU30280]MCA8277942.1 hypothetical protein [Burkholderia sp. AU30280]